MNDCLLGIDQRNSLFGVNINLRLASYEQSTGSSVDTGGYEPKLGIVPSVGEAAGQRQVL